MPNTLRRAAAALALALAALPAAARPGAAQRVTVDYAPICGGAPCQTLRFALANPGAATLTFTTLGLASGAAAFAFAPQAAGSPTVGRFDAGDVFGPFAGTTTIGDGGRSVFIDFFADAGFPFVLDPGTRGYVDLDVAEGAPGLGRSAFRYAASFDGGGAATGAVAVVPEPATVALVAGGLAVLAAARRRPAA